MSLVKIAPEVYWTGAIDWDIRSCGSYNTPRGTTYNAYLIKGEKIALIDSVKNGFEREMLQRISEAVDPAKIDYIICQHGEMDHSGAMPELMRAAKKAKVITSASGKETLTAHYKADWDFQIVKDGDELALGKKTLRFIDARMLHWPDNMFTFLKEDGILFSTDVFGQHIATHERYKDEIGAGVMEEATKYFAVIVSVYSQLVQKKLKELEGLKPDIAMIAPAHGTIWRDPQEILAAYERWSGGESGPRATLIFDTMWGSTGKMANEIARGLSHEGVHVDVFNLRVSDWSKVITRIIESRLIVVGSPTLNMGMYPTVGGFLTLLRGIRPPNKKASAFGSYGWGKGAVRAINDELEKMKFKILESLELKYVPGDEQLNACFAFGKQLANETKEGVIGMEQYKCNVCGYIYDPEKGDPENGIKPGTPFGQLPEDWVCPECKVGKENFEKV